MRVHVDGPSCYGCEEKLTGAHPYLREWYHRVKAKYPNTHISWAWRGMADQNECVKDGSSDLAWPKSEHNHMEDGKPCSLALDLFQIDQDGVARWSPAFFFKLNQDNLEDKESILWGGRWKTRGDANHFSLDRVAFAKVSSSSKTL